MQNGLTIHKLLALGFSIKRAQFKTNFIELSKNNFNLVIVDNDICYSNLGFHDPLKDVNALKKIYKEVTKKELEAA